jgi:hypothetical protein
MSTLHTYGAFGVHIPFYTLYPRPSHGIATRFGGHNLCRTYLSLMPIFPTTILAIVLSELEL